MKLLTAQIVIRTKVDMSDLAAEAINRAVEDMDLLGTLEGAAKELLRERLGSAFHTITFTIED